MIYIIANLSDFTIEGVYRDKTVALQILQNKNNLESDDVLNSYVKTKQVGNDKIAILEEDQPNDDKYYCYEIDIDKDERKTITKLYFYESCEYYGGESYKNDDYMYLVSKSKKKLISEAIEHFYLRHDEEDECRKCRKNICQKKLFCHLQKYDFDEITTTYSEGITFEIKKVEIN